jgi:CcmD family protein
MQTLKRWCAVVVLLVSWGIIVAAQPPEPKGEYVPVDKLPPTESMPAAPLLIGAYAFVMIVLFVYVFSVARRLSSVQRELNRLDATLKQGGRT